MSEPAWVVPPRVAAPLWWLLAACGLGLRSFDRDLLDLHGLRKALRGTRSCEQCDGRHFNYERTRAATPTRHYPPTLFGWFLLLAGVRLTNARLAGKRYIRNYGIPQASTAGRCQLYITAHSYVVNPRGIERNYHADARR